MGVYLSEPNKEKDTQTDKHADVMYVATGMQGWRKEMEDSHICHLDIVPGVHCFGVFDGHGGKEVALYVEKHFLGVLKSTPSFNKDWGQALKETFFKLDEKMLADKKGVMATIDGTEEDHSQAGCTATCIIVTPDEVICANSGDSRTVICEGTKADPMSEDHKPENEAEQERIENAGGFVADNRVNGNLALSRALGDFEYKNSSDKGPTEQ
jgi:serine/threonine protein phosphatase PrpC